MLPDSSTARMYTVVTLHPIKVSSFRRNSFRVNLSSDVYHILCRLCGRGCFIISIGKARHKAYCTLPEIATYCVARYRRYRRQNVCYRTTLCLRYPVSALGYFLFIVRSPLIKLTWTLTTNSINDINSSIPLNIEVIERAVRRSLY